MQEQLLFSDGTVDNDSKIGFGAYLLIDNKNLSVDELKSQIILNKFENTSPVQLELQTLLLAFNAIPENKNKITVYTNSYHITGVLEKREHFEENNFSTKRNRKIMNADLYKEFYRKSDELNCEFVKIDGLKAHEEKDDVDVIFTLVDRASRNSLRRHNL